MQNGAAGAPALFVLSCSEERERESAQCNNDAVRKSAKTLNILV